MIRRRSGTALLKELERAHDAHASSGEARDVVIKERLAALEAEQADLRKALRKINAARETD